MVRAAAAGVVIAVASVAVLVAAAPASAAGIEAPSPQDQAYLAATHQSNLAEIRAGQVAQQKGASPVVRRLGAELVADHARMDGDAWALAQRLNLTLPELPTGTQQAQLAAVSARSGTAFDAAWLESQVAAHRQAMTAGQAELVHGSDPGIKALARQMAPVIQTHLAALEQAMTGGMPRGVNAGTGGQAARLPAGAGLAGWALVGMAAVFVIGSAVRFGPRRAA